MSQPQIVKIPGNFKEFFPCKIVLAANHQYPGNLQRLFCLQNYLSRKSSKSREYSKTFWPAKLSQQQIINVPGIFKDFLPANLSQRPQIIKIPGIFKDFLACKTVLAANHQYLGNIQRLFRLQNCLSRKSSLSWHYSKNFLPAKLSQPQIIKIPGIFKDFLACKTVLAASHHYPGTIQIIFCLQNCLSRKSSISREYSQTFLPAKLSQPQIIKILEIFKVFRL